MPRFENNPNWTPVQTYRLEDNYLPFFISASQHDLHHTEPMLEPFRKASTREALASAMGGKPPLPFTILPIDAGVADKVIAVPHRSLLAELRDSGLSLVVTIGTDATSFVREAHYQRGMRVVMFTSVSEVRDACNGYMLQAHNIIATGRGAKGGIYGNHES